MYSESVICGAAIKNCKLLIALQKREASKWWEHYLLFLTICKIYQNEIEGILFFSVSDVDGKHQGWTNKTPATVGCLKKTHKTDTFIIEKIKKKKL